MPVFCTLINAYGKNMMKMEKHLYKIKYVTLFILLAAVVLAVIPIHTARNTLKPDECAHQNDSAVFFCRINTYDAEFSEGPYQFYKNCRTKGKYEHKAIPYQRAEMAKSVFFGVNAAKFSYCDEFCPVLSLIIIIYIFNSDGKKRVKIL